MINIDSLPKCIEFNGNWYTLNMHVTAFNKLCTSYKYIGGPMAAHERKIEYNILSQVVEPNMDKNIVSSNEVTDIVDVPTTEISFEILQNRLNNAIENKIIKVIYYGN